MAVIYFCGYGQQLPVPRRSRIPHILKAEGMHVGIWRAKRIKILNPILEKYSFDFYGILSDDEASSRTLLLIFSSSRSDSHAISLLGRGAMEFTR